jgi:hypothetical protein
MNHGRCFKSDCDNQELARGRCSKHYVEWSKAKDRDLSGVDPTETSTDAGNGQQVEPRRVTAA